MVVRSRWGRSGQGRPEDEPEPAAGRGPVAGLGGVGADHGQDVERPLAVAPQDHRAEHQQVVGLAVAEPDLADPRGDGHGDTAARKPAQDPPLAVVAVSSPALEPAGRPDRDDEQVEHQVQAQARCPSRPRPCGEVATAPRRSALAHQVTVTAVAGASQVNVQTETRR